MKNFLKILVFFGMVLIFLTVPIFWSGTESFASKFEDIASASLQGGLEDRDFFANLLEKEETTYFWFQPVKFLMLKAMKAGVSPNTMIFLLLLPGVSALIAAFRHLVGLRGFGIFLPASLSFVLYSLGPVLGIWLFLLIVFVSTFVRIFLRRLKIKLQYLPRMSLVLLFVVLAVLVFIFLSPFFSLKSVESVSVFPILILILLAEDFSRVQIGKSARVAVNLAIETLVLALFCYIFLTLNFIKEFVLANPEIYILSLFLVNIFVGKYVGLRLVEFWRFRKLLTG